LGFINDTPRQNPVLGHEMLRERDRTLDRAEGATFPMWNEIDLVSDADLDVQANRTVTVVAH